MVERRPAQPTPPVPGLPAVIRGGWQGFVVLLFGDLITLVVGRGSGLVLYWVAAMAYAVAGNRAAAAAGGSLYIAGRDGAMAAAFAYLLTIPLRQAAGTPVTLLNTGVALAAALIVGALAGLIVARARRSMGRADDDA